MTEDVATVIAAEVERRGRASTSALRGKGATLTSSSYGTIRLEADQRFTWKGFERLVPVGDRREGRGLRARWTSRYHVGRELSGGTTA